MKWGSPPAKLKGTGVVVLESPVVVVVLEPPAVVVVLESPVVVVVLESPVVVASVSLSIRSS